MNKLTDIFTSIDIISKTAEFIPTGFPKLDYELDGGFMRKELVVLGGFTGAGKSFIAGQILYNATKNMFNTAYFSLEISNEMIVSRLLGQESGIKPTRIMTGKLTEEEKLRQIEAQGRLSIYNDNMVFIDDKYYLGEILKTINDNNFDFIVIDFIQNVMDRGDEYEKLSKVALELQKIAKKKNCCIAILSQLSNSAYKTDALEYKGSGSIATVCDLGIFVIRKEDSLDKMTLKVRKNRRGRSGIEVELQNFYPSGRIVEL